MKPIDLPQDSTAAADELNPLSQLLQGPALPIAAPSLATAPTAQGVVIGTLLALTDDGQTPLVSFAGQPGSAAIRARSVVDLHGPHMGCQVVLMFEQGDMNRPIVMGVVRGPAGWPEQEAPATVDVDADGQRMLVSAKDQLVLRCGKASITLTRSGQVLIDGTYIASRSSGVNRVKGGAVQLN